MSEKKTTPSSDDISQGAIESKKESWVTSWEDLNPFKGVEKKSTQHVEETKEAEKSALVIDAPKSKAKKVKATDAAPSKVDSWLQSFNPFDPERIKKEEPSIDAELIEPVVIDESKIRQRLTKWFFFSFILFSIWAVYAPIDAGVTAMGQVVVSGYRKVVQHPTGGIVREIMVADGDMVEEGQVLFKINPLTLQAQVGTIQSSYINILAIEARLMAERLGTAIKWPQEFNTLSNPEQIKEAQFTQESLFKARRNEYLETMHARQAQLKSLITEEKNLQELAKEGLVPRASAEQAMRNRLESENTINGYKSNYIKQIETELAEAQKQRESLQLQLTAAKFDESQTSIQSPASGTVIGLKVVTVGGVITSGQILAEVVPRDAKLVIDVKLPATVIDRVKKGALVDLHFTAFNMATTPTVPGRVMKVGSDRVLPDKTKPGEPDFEYYAAQVETTEEGLKMLGDLDVQPGMPVDVVIKTGTRSFVSWLVKPISDRLNWAFK